MNQNTAGRVVVVEGAPTKDKREGKAQKRKTLQIRKNNQSEKKTQIFEEKVRKETGEKQKRGESTRGDSTGKSSEKDFKMNRRQQNKVEI